MCKRDWGFWDVLKDYHSVKVKELVIEPGKSLSLQRHFERSELWFCVSGVVHISVDDEMKELHPTDQLLIPVKAWHRAWNDGEINAVVVEIQFGTQCVEDDIERAELSYE